MRACEDCGFRPAVAGGALCKDCGPGPAEAAPPSGAQSSLGTAAENVQVSELDRLRSFGSALWLTFVFSFLGALGSAVAFVGAENPETSALSLVFTGVFSLVANATLLAGIISSVMYRHSRVLLEGLQRLSLRDGGEARS